MFRFLISAVGFLVGIFFASCKDRNCPDILKYQIPYTITPLQDTFQLGDTIWMEMNFNDHLTDLNGGIENTFSNFDFKIQLQCGRFDVDPPQGRAVSFMDVFPTISEVVPRVLSGAGVSYYEVKPVYENNYYRFKGTVVLKQQGVFFCGVSPYTDNLIAPFKIKGNCDDVPLRIYSKVNDGDPTENNYYLLKSSPVDVYRNMTLERFGQGAFCFVVR